MHIKRGSLRPDGGPDIACALIPASASGGGGGGESGSALRSARPEPVEDQLIVRSEPLHGLL